MQKWEIWDLEMCRRAAELLELDYSSASFSSASGTPHGCVYDSALKSLEIKLGDARSGDLSSGALALGASTTGTRERLCGPLAPFTRVQRGFCEDLGYQAILTAARCGLAASALGFSMSAHSGTTDSQAPGGHEARGFRRSFFSLLLMDSFASLHVFPFFLLPSDLSNS